MRDVSELTQAAALLALAMVSGDVLSGCKQAAEAPPPRVSPESASVSGPASVDDLRRAAAVINEWQHRDPAQAARVLREHGIAACDDATTARIAARQATDAEGVAADAAVAASDQPPTRIAVRPRPRDTRPARA